IEQHHSLAETYGQEDPAVGCASFNALNLWLLGFPDQSLGQLHASQTLSEKLENPHSAGFAMAFTGIAYQLRRDPLATQKQADDLIQFSTEQGLYWIANGTILKGWAKSVQTPDAGNVEMMKHGLRMKREAGANIAVPYFLGLLAEAQLALGQIADAQASVKEGLALVEKSRERWFEAELHRMQGELTLEQDATQQSEAERCFARSLEVAREQQAKSLELRAALSLGRLWLQQRRSTEARDLLQPICAWFGDGVENDELRDARLLMKLDS
ncbi:MAG: hypothetical protein ACR2P1_20735, partial [Pseudomonadales bacterium]